jgi:hypothetical protein
MLKDTELQKLSLKWYSSANVRSPVSRQVQVHSQEDILPRSQHQNPWLLINLCGVASLFLVSGFLDNNFWLFCQDRPIQEATLSLNKKTFFIKFKTHLVVLKKQCFKENSSRLTST